MSKYFLTISLLFIGATSFSQSGIDHDKLNTELDRFELELLHLYIKNNDELKNYKETKPEYDNRVNAGWAYIQEQKKSDWNGDNIGKIRTNLKDKAKFDWKGTTGDIEDLCKSLRGKCSDLKDAQQLSITLKEFVTVNPNSTAFQKKLLNHIETHSNGLLNKLIEGIIKRVAIKSDKLDSETAKDVDSKNGPASNTGLEKEIGDLQTEIKKLKEEIMQLENAPSSPPYLIYSLLLTMGIVLGSLIGWFFTKNPSSNGSGKRRKQELVKVVSRPNKQEPIPTVFEEQKAKNDKLEISNLNKINERLKKQVEQLEAAQILSDNSSNTNHHLPETKAEKVDEKKVLYLSSPNEDGTFSKMYQTESIGNRSYFEFVLTSENTADFHFIDDVTIQKKAIDTFGGRISQIAEELNWIDAQSKGIKVEQAGKAVIDGENWKVVTKAKIRYI